MDIKKELAAEGLEGFVKEFLKDRVEELDKLSNSVNEKKFSEIAALSHQWKSYCAPYGFGKLEEIAIEMEKAALRADIEECEKLYQAVKNYLIWKETQIEHS